MITALFIIGYIVLGLFTGRHMLRYEVKNQSSLDPVYTLFFFVFGALWPVILPGCLIYDTIRFISRKANGNIIDKFVLTDFRKAITSKEEKR